MAIDAGRDMHLETRIARGARHRQAMRDEIPVFGDEIDEPWLHAVARRRRRGALARGRQFGDRADDVIEAGRARGLVDEAVVRAQLIEPGSGRRGREKAPQSPDRGGDPRVVVGPAIDAVEADALGLRPQPRHRIVQAAIDQHRVDDHAAPSIEAVRVGKCDQPRDRLRPRPAGERRPAVEQVCPFVVMAGLGDAPLDAGRGRPVGGEELAHAPVAGSMNLSRQSVAMLSAMRRQAGSSSTAIQASAHSRRCMCGLARCGRRCCAILEVAALRMRAGLVQRRAQRHRVAPPAGVLAEHAMRRARRPAGRRPGRRDRTARRGPCRRARPPTRPSRPRR